MGGVKTSKTFEVVSLGMLDKNHKEKENENY